MPGPVEAPRSRMLTRPLVLAFASVFAYWTGFYLLLSVVPLYAASVGAGGAAAGFATGALMLATVAAELATPHLVARCGYRPVFAAGLVLLGAPALVLGAASTVAGVRAVCLARGLGLGIALSSSPWCRRPVVRRRAVHHDADDGLPQTEIPQTRILSVTACRFPSRSLEEVH